jgi:hypothetical protein
MFEFVVVEVGGLKQAVTLPSFALLPYPFPLQIYSTMPPLLEETHTVDEFDAPPQTGFTSSLMDTIIVSKSKHNDWAEIQKANIDKEAESYRQMLEQEQKCIDSLVTNLLGVQLERGLNIHPDDGSDENHARNLSNRKNALEDEEAKLELDLQQLKSEFITREKRVQGKYKSTNRQPRESMHTATASNVSNGSLPISHSDITMEESKLRLHAQEARSLNERVQEAKQTTVDDLTRGIVNYKYLGLDFEKTDGENELR